MYLEEKKQQYDTSIEKIEFRNKENGWKNYSVNIEFSDTQIDRMHYYEDKYMRMFLGNLDLRSSCYMCHFKGFPRVSDMTIGDSWGIEKSMPDMNDDKGTSIILVHSSKGKQMLEAVKESLNIKEANLDKALPRTADSRNSVEMHPNRKKYFEGVSRGESFDSLNGYLTKNFMQKVFGLLRYILIRFNLKR